ncbi:MAG: hypothetical protein HFJ42_06525 [Clostridia bacterium]|nr:hypothetical protein [Clostridia bacterium]
MSKLYVEYLKLKSENINKLYLFKSGIFYIAIEDDAKKLSELFNFKLTNLNDSVIKCGFPQKRLEFYIDKLNSLNILFEIIDLNYSKVDNYSDYLNNNKIKDIIKSIIQIDMNNISFKESFEFLEKIKIELNNVYNN